MERVETKEPALKGEILTRGEYKCKALENQDVDCSWIKQLNIIDLSNLLTFTAWKNTNCISYALEITESEE